MLEHSEIETKEIGKRESRSSSRRVIEAFKYRLCECAGCPSPLAVYFLHYTTVALTWDHPSLLIHDLRCLTDTHPPKKRRDQRPLLFYFSIDQALSFGRGTSRLDASLWQNADYQCVHYFPVPLATEHPPSPEGGAQELPGQVLSAGLP